MSALVELHGGTSASGDYGGGSRFFLFIFWVYNIQYHPQSKRVCSILSSVQHAKSKERPPL